MRLDHPQCRPEFPRGAFGVPHMVAVGLVHRDQLSDLEHALLDPLQLIAGSGEGEEREDIGHLGDRDFRLPDAHRFHEDDVEARSLEDDDRLPGSSRHAAQRA